MTQVRATKLGAYQLPPFLIRDLPVAAISYVVGFYKEIMYHSLDLSLRFVVGVVGNRRLSFAFFFICDT